jgi:hypothetical protein
LYVIVHQSFPRSNSKLGPAKRIRRVVPGRRRLAIDGAMWRGADKPEKSVSLSLSSGIGLAMMPRRRRGLIYAAVGKALRRG